MAGLIIPPTFLSQNWLDKLMEKLNNDLQYARIAQNWEGDLGIFIESGENLSEPIFLHLDLWRGKCRHTEFRADTGNINPSFLLTASYENILKILTGELNPMQAMMTRRLHVKGSMGYMMRNVPTVLDFVRCAREVTSEILG